jgi:phage terminase large subunit GpA-like protein
VKGHARLEWVKPVGRRNEALDCAVYALAGAVWVGIDRWKEGDWSKWELRTQKEPEAKPVEKPVTKPNYLQQMMAQRRRRPREE